MKSLFMAILMTALTSCSNGARDRLGSSSNAISARVPSGWAATVEDRPISRYMGCAVSRIARGNDDDWDEIERIWREKMLDGIAATCFDVSLGELFARNPSSFLERYLSGGLEAAELARRGYNLLHAENIPGIEDLDRAAIRRNALHLFKQRRAISSEEEKKEVDAFVSIILKGPLIQ